MTNNGLGKFALAILIFVAFVAMLGGLNAQTKQAERGWQLIKQDVETHWDGPDTTCYVLVNASGQALNVSCVHHTP